MSHKNDKIYIMDTDGACHLTSNQFWDCQMICERDHCPAEKIMEYKLNPEEFTCDLWREK